VTSRPTPLFKAPHVPTRAFDRLVGRLKSRAGISRAEATARVVGLARDAAAHETRPRLAGPEVTQSWRTLNGQPFTTPMVAG
jgi:hypothetical protein